MTFPVNPEEAGVPTQDTGSTWWLYVVECKGGSLYTGITTDVGARYQNHLAGKGARYTRARPPVRLLGKWPYPDKSSASKAEYRVKKMNAADKRRLVAGEMPPPLA